jgi:asparagine synthase (glutamine-hydrolysing)
VCGIAGLVGSCGPVLALDRMIEVIEHRGPDQIFSEVTPSYAMASCRLAINALHDGRQPLKAPCVTMFYNGEIYNHLAVRKQLAQAGVQVESAVDGAPVPYLYAARGIEGLGELDGPFALAIWDEARRTLVLARDPLGEKPLYYRRLAGGGLAFASETRALTQLEGQRTTLALQALWDIPTFLWTPEPATAFSEIFAVPAGHALSFSEDKVEINAIPRRIRGWTGPLSDEAAISHCRTLVEEAVETRAMSDVPLGTFLSGGLDSSLVTLLLNAGGHNVERCFTVRLPQFEDYQHGYVDEASQARALADALEIPLTVLELTQEHARSLLPAFVHAADQPSAVSSGFGVLAVAEAARGFGIKVLMSGDCADEAFGGYSWYPYLGIPGSTPYRAGFEPSFQSHGIPLDDRLYELARVGGPQRALGWHYYASEHAKKRVFSDWVSGQVEPSVRLMSQWRSEVDWTFRDFVDNDRDFYLSQEMLRKADRFAMSRSVEVRVPFAAPWLLDFARVLTPSQLVRGRTLKWLLREAFRDVLPEEIASRPKHGFNFPIAAWLRGPWRDLLESTFASGSRLADLGLIDSGSLRSAIELLDDNNRDHGHAVFSWVVLELWLEGLGTHVDC